MILNGDVRDTLTTLSESGHRYDAILADPPWDYGLWSDKGAGRHASQHYDCMPTADIAALPVGDIATNNCVLFLWVINPMSLEQPLEVLRGWGFEFKAVAFTWVKLSPTGNHWHRGLGKWTRQNTERCLLATRGRPRVLAHDVPELMVTRRKSHSSKPLLQYRRIERMANGPYCEMFARRPRDGWTVMGNELARYL